MATPFANALGQVLGSVEGLIIVDYKTSFDLLWSEGLTKDRFKVPSQETIDIDWNNPTTRVVIAGVDAPHQTWTANSRIDFAPHFGALSWLSAWRLLHKTASAQVAIVGNAAQCSEPPTAALATIFGSYESSGQNTVPGASYQPNLLRLLGWLARCEREERNVSGEIGLVISGIIWEALTAKREDHHAISNVVGAVLLGREVGNEDTSPQIERVLTLASGCGVETRSKKDKSEPWIGDELRNQIEGAVLIDDLDQAWKGFIGGALGVRSNVLCTEPGRFVQTMQGSGEQQQQTPTEDSFTSLPQRLTGFLESKKVSLSPTDLIPPSKSGVAANAENFILFLDLRLGLAGKFSKQLANFGLRLLESDRNLPWIAGGTDRESLRAELSAFATGKPTTATMEISTPSSQETLLPRILSLLDPTLPIVIFSSTHGTDLIDPFRNYGNLITSFRKPILTGMTRDWSISVRQLRVDFRSTMEQAARILRVRRRFAKLRSSVVTIHEEGLMPKNGKRLVEIFFDESGNPTRGPNDPPRFGVGGLCLVHQGGPAREAFHRLIDDQLKWGISDNSNLNPSTLLSRKCVPKLAGIVDKKRGFKKIEDAAEKSHSLVTAFTLSVSAADPNTVTRTGPPHLLDPHSLDNLYLELLSNCLEILLFHCPLICIGRDEIEIFAADRQVSLTSVILRKWQDAFGIQAVAGGYRSMPFDGVFRIIPPLLRAHRIKPADVRIERALAVKLEYLEKAVERRDKIEHLQRELDTALEERQIQIRSTLSQLNTAQEEAFAPLGTKQAPKQIHYAADWIAKVGKFMDAARLIPPTNKWFMRGFIQDYSDDFRQEMAACQNRNPLNALNSLPSALPSSKNIEYSAERWLLSKAAKWPNQLNGEQLRQLFDRA